MNPMDPFLQEFENEAVTTRLLLESVPEDKYSWRADEKAMSLSELCGHIAMLPTTVTEVLGGESFDFDDRPPPGGAPTSRDEILASFDKSVELVTTWMEGLGEQAGATWRLYRGGKELMAMPRAAAIRSFLLNHLYHHRGQLSAYLRASGCVVPPVYGPTADIDPFLA